MTSPRIQVSLREIREEWSIYDILDAHDVLDAIDKAEARAAKKNKVT